MFVIGVGVADGDVVGLIDALGVEVVVAEGEGVGVGVGVGVAAGVGVDEGVGIDVGSRGVWEGFGVGEVGDGDGVVLAINDGLEAGVEGVGG